MIHPGQGYVSQAAQDDLGGLLVDIHVAAVEVRLSEHFHCRCLDGRRKWRAWPFCRSCPSLPVTIIELGVESNPGAWARLRL